MKYMGELKKELIKKTGEVFKENIENLTVPLSSSVGNNVGKMIEGVFGWLGAWGEVQKIKQEKYIEEFKFQFLEEYKKIPTDRIVEPKMSIIGPTLETAKFYYDEKYYQEMFSKILAKSCDLQFTEEIHPAFIETIKQLKPLDAKIIEAFKSNNTYPIAELRAKNSDGTITPFPLILCYFKDLDDKFSIDERLKINTSIENLCRLGIIIKNREVIELKYDYENFKEDRLYKMFDESIEKEAKIEIIKYRMELTSYGQAFFNVCIK